MEVRGTDFVMFFVSDLKRSMGFYRDALGLELVYHNEQLQWAEFNVGNVTLMLCENPKTADEKFGGVFGLAVKDINRATAYVRERDISVKSDLQESATCWHMEILDPDGYTVILHQRKDGTFGQT